MAVIRFISRSIMWTILLSIALIGWAAADIALFSHHNDTRSADAAVVLGAAVYGSRPSPIFRERIHHAVDLYEAGQVEKLVFTGGQGHRGRVTEGEAGRQYAIQRGVPAADILVETESTNTAENLANILSLSAENDLNTVIIVSTPFHQRRAVFIASRLGITAYSSPTRTTRWLGTGTRQHLFTREIGAYLYYRLFWGPEAHMHTDDLHLTTLAPTASR